MDIQLSGSHENQFLYQCDKHLREHSELFAHHTQFNLVAAPLCAVGRIIILFLYSVILFLTGYFRP
jgi:hypothetical protein